MVYANYDFSFSLVFFFFFLLGNEESSATCFPFCFMYKDKNKGTKPHEKEENYSRGSRPLKIGCAYSWLANYWQDE